MICFKSLIVVLATLATVVSCDKREVRETRYPNGNLKEQYFGKYDTHYSENFKKDGRFTTWYENGQTELKGTYKDGEFQGLITQWYENGKKKSEFIKKTGKRDGPFTCWYENGQTAIKGTYKDEEFQGLFTQWYENGQKKEESIWKDGKIDKQITEWYENGQKKDNNEAPAYGDMTYAGLKFGLSKEQVYSMFRNVGVAAHGGEDDNGAGIKVVQFDTILAPVGGAYMTICEFCDEKLFEIQLIWPEKSDFDECMISFNEVKSILGKKYGNSNGGTVVKPGLYQTKWGFDKGKFLIHLSIVTPEENGAHTLGLMYCNNSIDICSDRNRESSKGTGGF